MLSGKIKPLYNDEILDEYFDVLNRSKFHLSEIRIHELLNFFNENGIDTSRFPYDGEMPDEDDRVRSLTQQARLRNLQMANRQT